MITDARTVAWKELQEILSRGGTSRRKLSVIGSIVFPVVLGLFLGIQAGQSHRPFARGFAVLPVGLLAMAMAASLIADAVAGERERHTLETLLASPVSDGAILAGKIGAVVGYAWAVALIQLTAVALGAAIGGDMLAPSLLLLVAVLALLEAILAAAFGIQFSLRAPTVRAASRKQGQYSIFINFTAAGVNVFAAAPTRGGFRVVAVSIATVILVAADTLLLRLARARFRRGVLLLD